MAPPIPTPPGPQQVALSLIGLVCVVISLIVAFQQPYGYLHWLLLLVALGCLYLSRRISR